MPQPRHLRSAPITEAIIDLRVKANPELHVEQFSSLRSTLSNRFPKVEERRGGRITFQFSATPPKPTVEDLGPQGLFFKSADEKLIAQFRLDGFTLNRLKPYTSWEELIPIAMELWTVYCETASPQAVTRLALRYINHVPLPPDLTDFDKYLRAAPTVPSELPQDVSAFFSRVTIHDPDKDLAAHIVQTLEIDPEKRNFILLLDIDAFREVHLSPADPDIITTFTYLHDFKNLVFFNLLTEEILRRFE